MADDSDDDAASLRQRLLETSRQLEHAFSRNHALEEQLSSFHEVVHEEHETMARARALGCHDPELEPQAYKRPGPSEVFTPAARAVRDRLVDAYRRQQDTARGKRKQQFPDYAVVTTAADLQQQFDGLTWPRGNRPPHSMTLPPLLLNNQPASPQQVVEHFNSPSGFECPHLILSTVPDTDERKGARGGRSVLATMGMKAGNVLQYYKSFVCLESELETFHPPWSDELWRRLIMAHPSNPSDARDPLIMSPWSYGNITQFINDPRITPYDNNDTLKPPNCMFLSINERGWERMFIMLICDVRKGEELTISYGPDYWPFMKKDGLLSCKRWHHLIDPYAVDVGSASSASSSSASSSSASSSSAVAPPRPKKHRAK
jgi:hypothetical protein